MASTSSPHFLARAIRVKCASDFSVCMDALDDRWIHYAEVGSTLPNSLVGLEELLEMERILITNLEAYGDELQMRLDVVRSAVTEMREENTRSMGDVEGYLANPINSFSLIRRMREDWMKWEVYIKKPLGQDQVKTLRQHRFTLPKARDLREAVMGILRIQTTYELKASDMARGFLYNKQYESTFSVLDCAAIGFNLFARENYEYATHWLQVALEMHEKSELNEALQLERNSLLEMYLDSLLKQMRAIDALRVIEGALQKQPTNALLLMKQADIEYFIKSMSQPSVTLYKEPDPYECGCRGEYANKISNLYCSYNNRTSAFLKLAPLKMEVIHQEPYLVMYHDFVSNKEIKILKKLALPILEPASVCPCGKKRKDTLRAAKIAWLSEQNSDTVFRINQRIGDITGLNMKNSEDLQVSSYGLGGHFIPHGDYLGNEELTDVEQGGLTVFPLINKSVKARKGTAIMWYNLNNRGERDLNTVHGGCPVLVGSKWVATKWIRSRDQEFRKPCYKE